MSLYVDTSCFLKLFFPEPETARTIALIGAESTVKVSSLTRLEALLQIQARIAGRLLGVAPARRLATRMDTMLQHEPWQLEACPADLIEIAERQVLPTRRSGKAHCRTLDRLHLAAMESLGLKRLLTNDDRQARAARALGFVAILPR